MHATSQTGEPLLTAEETKRLGDKLLADAKTAPSDPVAWQEWDCLISAAAQFQTMRTPLAREEVRRVVKDVTFHIDGAKGDAARQHIEQTIRDGIRDIRAARQPERRTLFGFGSHGGKKER